MQTRSPHVIVIGGGVAGPALSLFLKKAGISSALHEAYPFVQGIGGGLGLAPNGMKVLAALGVAGELTKRATTISRYDFRNGHGTLLARARLDASVNGQPMLAMSRALLFETLAAAMRDREIDVHYNKRLARIEEGPDSVIAHFEDGSSAEGDLLVGADGVRSVVRRHVLPDAQADYMGMVGIGGFTPLSALPDFPTETMVFVFGRRGFFGYSGADTGLASWWTNLFREEPFGRDEYARTDVTQLKDELLARFGHYHEPIPSLIAHSTNVLQLNVYDIRSLPRWHQGRIILIGDAAHAVSPNSGQGASLALEDAMYLAKLLRDQPYESAFAQFERERRPRAEKVVAEGRRRGNDKAIVGPMQQWMRELMIRIFIPLFGRHGDRWLYEYNIPW